MTSEAQQLADRYIGAWTEMDASGRRNAVATLWIEDGRHCVGTRAVQGYDALEERIIESHDKWVRDRSNRFRARDAQTHHDSITFYWDMLATEGETVLAIGLEFLLLNERGRITTDYQYIVKPPAGGRDRRTETIREIRCTAARLNSEPAMHAGFEGV